MGAEMVEIDLIQHLIKGTMVALVIEGADFRCLDASGQGMPAGEIGAIVTLPELLGPARDGRRLMGLDLRATQCVLHTFVKGTVVAVISIVTILETDHTGLHPDAFVFNHLKTSDALASF